MERIHSTQEQLLTDSPELIYRCLLGTRTYVISHYLKDELAHLKTIADHIALSVLIDGDRVIMTDVLLKNVHYFNSVRRKHDAKSPYKYPIRLHTDHSHKEFERYVMDELNLLVKFNKKRFNL